MPEIHETAEEIRQHEEELKNNFDIIPKKTDNKRDRLEEEKLLSGKEDKVYSKDNLIPDNAVKEEKIVESKTKKYTKVE